jgi:hypothetical protein
MKALFIFRSFTHDPQGVLTAVRWLAFVIVELYLNIGVWIHKVRLELSVTPFAYANGRGRGFPYNPKALVRHDRSLTHLVRRA